MRGNIILYTGDGGGKTAAALGLALRSLGHGHKVVMIQFMKGRKDIGEYLIKERLSPEFEVYQAGREEFVNLEKPDEIDRKLAEKGLEFCREVLKRKPDLLILDEMNIAVAAGLLNLDEVLALLKEIPEGMVVVLTGRYAPKELMEKADYVVEINDLKRPAEEIPPRKGIEY
ncbi:MAG: cob(I)yrinic acid a,c-diamide adenosyltransferase [Candidatus Altiarchaeota archaeon]|nr:cob(I)yrinic acid a,c-diamide adenosyltransferase [Candidatus Altiarchaeota archaeon]